MKTYGERHRENIEEDENFENKEEPIINRAIKIFAITFSNRIFRVVVEIDNTETWKIYKLFKNTKYYNLSNLIYNITDKIVIKNRYSKKVSHDTIINLFGYLPLITINEFTKEIVKFDKGE